MTNYAVLRTNSQVGIEDVFRLGKVLGIEKVDVEPALEGALTFTTEAVDKPVGAEKLYLFCRIATEVFEGRLVLKFP